MHAVAAPASIRVEALDIVVKHLGPVCLSKGTVDAGGAMELADMIAGLETRFSIDLDDFWRATTIDELACLVERRVLDGAQRALIDEFEAWRPPPLCARRAHPLPSLAPLLALRQRRIADAAIRRRSRMWTWARLVGSAAGAGCAAALLSLVL